MVQIQAFRRELEVFVNEALSAEEQLTLFVATSLEALDDFEDQWRDRLGVVSFERYVDGVLKQDISQVQFPGGVVSERVVAASAILDRGLELFDLYTKVVTGGYKAETHIFVNDSRVSDVRDLQGEDLIVIANVSEFPRQAEQQEFNVADGAPITSGLFEGVATQLRREFEATLNSVYYTWRTIEGRRVPVVAIGGPASFSGRRRFGVDSGKTPTGGNLRGITG